MVSVFKCQSGQHTHIGDYPAIITACAQLLIRHGIPQQVRRLTLTTPREGCRDVTLRDEGGATHHYLIVAHRR